jgi:hypothetical protein
MMFRTNNCQIRQLQAQVARLKREKEQLRLFLHEIIEAYYWAINQSPTSEKKEVKDE